MTVCYLNDNDLAEGMRKKDHYAFEALLDKYGDRVLKTCYLILKDIPSAEDAVQETFTQVYKSIRGFNGRSSLYTWIYKIAVNKCRDIMGKTQEYSLYDDSLDTHIEADTQVETEAIENMDRARIRDMVFAMPQKYREVIILFYFEDLPIRDICTVLGEGEGTVKSKLHRARNILKNSLSKEAVEYGKGQI